MSLGAPPGSAAWERRSLTGASSSDILEPRSGKRILAWRVSARLIVTGSSSPERAADILSLSVALSGLAVLVLVFPRAYALG
jgi:hypothetical protein